MKQRDTKPDLRVLDNAADWSAQVMLESRQAFEQPLVWDQFRVLVACMGSAPSGGWSVALAQRDLVLQADAITVPLRRMAPSAGAAVTQAYTAPCMFILLPRARWQRANLALVD